MFPNGQQELLLKACLLEGDAALENWQAWRDLIGVDALDTASQRLLPLAYRNLSKCGVGSSELERYRSVARYVWYENHSRMVEIEALLRVFAAAEIPTMVLKGAALAPLYYQDLSLRPTNDIDILVPVHLAEKAGSELERRDWRPISAAPLGSSLFKSTVHAAAYRGTGYRELDLHWHVVPELCAEDADDCFWEKAQRLNIGSVATLALGDTDQLFHTIVHATGRDTAVPIRWVADAAMILRRSEIDWDRLSRHVAGGNFVRRARLALQYLSDRFRLAIPEQVLNELESMHPASIESFEARVTDSSMPHLLWKAGKRYTHYRRNRKSNSVPQGFPAYLRATWGCETWGETLKAGFSRLPPYLGFSKKG